MKTRKGYLIPEKNLKIYYDYKTNKIYEGAYFNFDFIKQDVRVIVRQGNKYYDITNHWIPHCFIELGEL